MSQYHFTLVCCVFGGGCQIITEQLGFSLEAGELQIIDANWHVTHINRVFFGWRVARSVTVSAYKTDYHASLRSRRPSTMSTG